MKFDDFIKKGPALSRKEAQKKPSRKYTEKQAQERKNFHDDRFYSHILNISCFVLWLVFYFLIITILSIIHNSIPLLHVWFPSFPEKIDLTLMLEITKIIIIFVLGRLIPQGSLIRLIRRKNN